MTADAGRRALRKPVRGKDSRLHFMLGNPSSLQCFYGHSGPTPRSGAQGNHGAGHHFGHSVLRRFHRFIIELAFVDGMEGVPKVSPEMNQLGHGVTELLPDVLGGGG